MLDRNKLQALLNESFPKFDFIVEIQDNMVAIEGSFSGLIIPDGNLSEEAIIKDIKTYLEN